MAVSGECIVVFLAAVLIFKGLQAAPFSQGINLALGLGAGTYLIPYLALLATALVAMALTRQGLRVFGIVFNAITTDGKIIALAFLPFLAVKAALFLVDWKNLPGALLVSLVEVLALAAIAWLLNRSALPPPAGMLAAVPLLLAGGAGDAAARAVYMVLVAVAEEVFFRGYVQTRLNQQFGSPWRFFGVSWGLGLPLSALFFACWHIFQYNPFSGAGGWMWTWGLWTFFFGLLLGFLREKSGRLLAPAGLHWVVNI
ncbi:MAG TPA: CPBP family intramembrane glutamic endopeptidase [Anaerolineaceae bacterium]